MSNAVPQTAEYRCPGGGQPISRAVHLGRMARFYPGCRRCPHRDDTGTLSARQVGQLVETRFRGLPRRLFHDEWVGGIHLNDLAAADVRRLAAGLGLCLRHRSAVRPVVLVGGDGRPISSELAAAAAGEGLRWAGCNVVDVAMATSACLSFAIDHLRADGGILVGNPTDRPHTIGLKFWADGPVPLSAGGALDMLERLCQAGLDRPARSGGSIEHFGAEAAYLADVADHYHALRPLRLVLHTCCLPLKRYLAELTEPVACRIVPSRTTLEGLPEQVRTDRAHFGASIHDDGETCRLWDEQGRLVPAERALLLLAGHLFAEQPQGTVVLEQGTPSAIGRKIEAAGERVVLCDARRSAMAGAMLREEALLGGGTSGRLWHRRGRLGLPDALMTLTLLLVILSQSDRPFSRVLDEMASPK